MKVAKVEGGLVVQIPDEIAEALNLKAGDEVVIRAARDRALEIDLGDRQAELLASIKRLARPLPDGWRFDRDEANAR